MSIRGSSTARLASPGIRVILGEDMELALLVNSPDGSPGQFLRGVVTNVYLQNIE